MSLQFLHDLSVLECFIWLWVEKRKASMVCCGIEWWEHSKLWTRLTISLGNEYILHLTFIAPKLIAAKAFHNKRKDLLDRGTHMPVYFVCGCLKWGTICWQFAYKGCFRTALDVSWAMAAASAIPAHQFLVALGCFAMLGASAPLFSRLSLLTVSLKIRIGKGLCIFGWESETSEVWKNLSIYWLIPNSYSL